MLFSREKSGLGFSAGDLSSSYAARNGFLETGLSPGALWTLMGEGIAGEADEGDAARFRKGLFDGRLRVRFGEGLLSVQ